MSPVQAIPCVFAFVSREPTSWCPDLPAGDAAIGGLTHSDVRQDETINIIHHVFEIFIFDVMLVPRWTAHRAQPVEFVLLVQNSTFWVVAIFALEARRLSFSPHLENNDE